jgi:hypothetical protein
MALSPEDRLHWIETFFSENPGFAQGDYGFGTGIVDFTRWEVTSGRLDKDSGSTWYRAVNGMLVLDMRDALALLHQGKSSSKDPGVQNWLSYAGAARGMSKLPGSTEMDEVQKALWTAHQTSLHQGIRAGAPFFAKDWTVNREDAQFNELVVRNVDLAALSNQGTRSGWANAGLLDAAVAVAYPSHYPASRGDTYTGGLLSGFFDAGSGRWQDNIGIGSTRW